MLIKHNVLILKMPVVGRQTIGEWARSVTCYWTVRELGMTTVDVSRRLGITQSAVTKTVYRGEKLASGKGFR